MTMETMEDGTPSVIADAEARGDDDGLIEAIHRVTTDWAKRIEGIQTVLLRTRSAKVRNAAALALVDMNAKAACDSLAAILRRPGIGQEAGTLLYALDELGGRLPLDVAIDLIEHGSYEARAETVLLLQASRIAPFGSDAHETAARRLSALQSAPDAELGDAAAIALEAIAHRTAA